MERINATLKRWPKKRSKGDQMRKGILVTHRFREFGFAVVMLSSGAGGETRVGDEVMVLD